jgi:anti-sigma B factor antagonist
MLEIRKRKDEKITVLEIEGEVDLYSSPNLRSELLGLTNTRTKAVIIDLADVKYMDSSGVATLVEALQQVGKYGGKLKLVNLREAVKDVFELSRLDKVFDIYQNMEDAKGAF